MLVVAACGGDDGTNTNPVGGAAGTGAVTPRGGTTGTPSGAAGTGTSTGTAGKPAGAAGTGTAPVGRAGTGAPTPGTGASGTGTTTTLAGTGASGTGAATAGTGATASGGSGGSTVGGDGPTTGGDSEIPDCLKDAGTDFSKEGKFQYMQMRQGSVNVWMPMLPAGCKVPVIHLANGTGASCSSYGQALVRFATWGFLTTCYESANTGSGAEGLEALKTAVEMFPDVADKKFGSTGHSQGGQASFIVLQFAEDEFGADGKFAGLAMQPASGFGNQPMGGSWQSIYKKIKSPMFMFSGQGSDGLVSQGWVMDAFNNLDKGIEAYFWAKAGGMHIPTPQGEEMQLGPAWFRWKLLGDNEACKYFTALPTTDTTWEVAAHQNDVACK